MIKSWESFQASHRLIGNMPEPPEFVWNLSARIKIIFRKKGIVENIMGEE